MRIGLTSNWHLPFIAVALLAAFAMQACSSDPGEIFEVLVWADEPITEEDFFPDGEVFDGPCGPMRLLKVRNLVELSTDQFDSLERVLELLDLPRLFVRLVLKCHLWCSLAC